MIYNVLAVHTWNIQLGVIGYLTNGDVFQEAVDNLVTSFPKMRIEIPVGDLESDTIYAAFHNAAASYLSGFEPNLTRVELSRLKAFLDSLCDEYRRWRFDAGMEAQPNDSVMEELLPLIQLHKAVRSDDFSVTKTLIDYTVEALAQFFSHAIVEEFQESVKLFQLRHLIPITQLAVTLDFPKSQYNIMDMRLLIHTEEKCST